MQQKRTLHAFVDTSRPVVWLLFVDLVRAALAPTFVFARLTILLTHLRLIDLLADGAWTKFVSIVDMLPVFSVQIVLDVFDMCPACLPKSQSSALTATPQHCFDKTSMSNKVGSNGHQRLNERQCRRRQAVWLLRQEWWCQRMACLPRTMPQPF
jgi:hypothetical protein